jgi:hypothetical protein
MYDGNLQIWVPYVPDILQFLGVFPSRSSLMLSYRLIKVEPV